MREPEHGLELLAPEAAEQRAHLALVDAVAGRIEQRVLVALAPHQRQLVAIFRGDAAADAQIWHLVQVRVAGGAGNAEEQIDRGAERGALAGGVGADDDVEGARLVRKVEHDVGERPELLQIEA